MPPEKTQTALIMKEPGKASVVRDLAIPSPDPGQLLVRVHAVALNPSDWMALDSFFRPGAGVGCDFAGTVEEIGDLTQSTCTWTVGDHVAGFVHGGHAANYSIGAFRDYLLVDADMVLRVPNHFSLAEASTVGMGITTAGQALHQCLQIRLPECGTEQPRSGANVNVNINDGTVLIHGGGSATGAFAIQLAKSAGLRVIATCSNQSISRVQSLQPDEIVDYNRPDAIATIRNHARGSGLMLILDCVANDTTAAFCHQCFTIPGYHQHDTPTQTETKTEPEFKYASLLPIQKTPPRPAHIPATATLTSKFNLVYTCFGRRFNLLGQTWEAAPTDRAFAVALYRGVERLWGRDDEDRPLLRPMSVDVRGGEGWEGVLEGISELRRYGARGRKLVYLI